MKKILVLTSFSKKAEHAAEFALNIARAVGTDLELLHVYTSPEEAQTSRTDIRMHSIEQEAGKKEMKKLVRHLLNSMDKRSPDQFRPKISGKFAAGEADQLGDRLEHVSSKNNWMIVMGTKGDDCLSNFILSTNTYSVINKAECPVLFVPEHSEIKDISKIAVIIDSEETDLSLLSFLKDFKEKFNSKIIAASILPPAADSGDNPEKDIEISLYNITSAIQKQRNPFQKVRSQRFLTELRLFGLISQIDVLGIFFRRENIFERLFQSNTTKLLIDNAQLPLLVFPQPR